MSQFVHCCVQNSKSVQFHRKIPQGSICNDKLLDKKIYSSLNVDEFVYIKYQQQLRKYFPGELRGQFEIVDSD